MFTFSKARILNSQQTTRLSATMYYILLVFVVTFKWQLLSQVLEKKTLREKNQTQKKDKKKKSDKEKSDSSFLHYLNSCFSAIEKELWEMWTNSICRLICWSARVLLVLSAAPLSSDYKIWVPFFHSSLICWSVFCPSLHPDASYIPAMQPIKRDTD